MAQDLVGEDDVVDEVCVDDPVVWDEWVQRLK
jgi:hypothetical protein